MFLDLQTSDLPLFTIYINSVNWGGGGGSVGTQVFSDAKSKRQ